MTELMLNVNSINTYYSNVHALKDISLKINKGSLISVIGANGVGKSTFLIQREIPTCKGGDESKFPVTGTDNSLLR